jgi:hypothetical protein
MAQVRISQDVTELLVGFQNTYLTQDVTEYLYTVFGSTKQVQISQDVTEYLFAVAPDTPPAVPTVECNFGSSFQAGVLRGQGVCE